MTTDELLEQITTDIYHLHYVWDTFLLLFASDKKNVDVLNAVGPGFFAMNQTLMYDDVLLRINRITDRAKVAGKDTASLEQLLHLTGWQRSDPAQWKIFSDELRTVKAACKECRAHRNRRVSHRELDQATPLPPTTRKMVEAAIEAVERFVSLFSRELRDVEIPFVVPNVTDHAEQLLRHLTNRRSQKQPTPETRISYLKGNRRAELQCGFCGKTEVIGYYPDGQTSTHLRLHFAKCDGVIGCEMVTIEAVERNGAEPLRTITVDLRTR
jgi:hypothetical protein